MSIPSRLAVCLLSFAVSPVALAQTTSTESTAVTRQVRTGEVAAVYGNKVVLNEADGLHEYTVPDGFKFQLDGQNVGVDQIKPGMKVGALITDKVTTREVTVTTVKSATVMQIAPGGIVVKNEKGDLKSYNFKDAAGNDIYFIRDGKEVSLRSVKKGERLTGTFVTTLPPQETSQRSVTARAVAPAEPPAPVEVAAATPHRRLPKTASPLPLMGLLGALSAGIAFTLRAARAGR
jgi:hypothetical protein